MKLEMNSKLDLADSILALERQAAQQAEESRKDNTTQTLQAIIKDCDMALTRSDINPSDRQWVQTKKEQAQEKLAHCIVPVPGEP